MLTVTGLSTDDNIRPTMVHLPEDILEEICDFFQKVNEHENGRAAYLPNAEFVPLMRVCKSWYPVTERYLYTNIAVGSRFQHYLPKIEGETLPERRTRIRLILSTQPKRFGWQIVSELLATLETNRRLAGIVRVLKLGVMSVDYRTDPEWTERNVQVLRLCPNVEHVEIRGMHQTKTEVVLNALKEKSLVSLYINPTNLTHDGLGSYTARQLLDAIRAWPKLRILRADILGPGISNDPLVIESICPNLQTVILNGHDLQENELKALHVLCPNVSRLTIPLPGAMFGQADKTLDALCECLHTWSPTLECFRLSFRLFVLSHDSFTNALSRLHALRELRVWRMEVDLECLSNLPNLERLYHFFTNSDDPRTVQLASLLRNQTKFTSLKTLEVQQSTGNIGNELKNICSRRGIAIRDWKGADNGFVL